MKLSKYIFLAIIFLWFDLVLGAGSRGGLSETSTHLNTIAGALRGLGLVVITISLLYGVYEWLWAGKGIGFFGKCVLAGVIIASSTEIVRLAIG